MKPVSARLPVRAISRSTPDPPLDLLALGGGALVVPEDRGPDHPVALVEGDEPVHLAREADSRGVLGVRRAASAASLARHQSSGSCSAQPGAGVASGYSRSARATTSPFGETAIALTPVVPTSRPTNVLPRAKRRVDQLVGGHGVLAHLRLTQRVAVEPFGHAVDELASAARSAALPRPRPPCTGRGRSRAARRGRRSPHAAARPPARASP